MTVPHEDEIEVLRKVYELFQNWEDVFHWMVRKQRALGNARPVELLGEREGREKLRTLLEQLLTGAFV